MGASPRTWCGAPSCPVLIVKQPVPETVDDPSMELEPAAGVIVASWGGTRWESTCLGAVVGPSWAACSARLLSESNAGACSLALARKPRTDHTDVPIAGTTRSPKSTSEFAVRSLFSDFPIDAASVRSDPGTRTRPRRGVAPSLVSPSSPAHRPARLRTALESTDVQLEIRVPSMTTASTQMPPAFSRSSLMPPSPSPSFP